MGGEAVMTGVMVVTYSMTGRVMHRMLKGRTGGLGVDVESRTGGDMAGVGATAAGGSLKAMGQAAAAAATAASEKAKVERRDG